MSETTTPKKPLPFTPEPLDQLKARYADAILYTWMPDRNMVDRPGLHREHVFDCEDGLRLIISKDFFGEVDMIHFSVSIESELYGKDKPNPGYVNATLLERYENRFREISGETKPLHIISISPMLVPHYLVAEEGVVFLPPPFMHEKHQS